MLGFRTKGKYTTVNDYIARNPNVSQHILTEMFRGKEIGNLSLALNPNCPIELMWAIFDEGNSVDQAWLARNPNLPEDLRLKLKAVRDTANTKSNEKKR